MGYDFAMEEDFRWSEKRDGGVYRLPGPEHLGRWATAAMLVSILLHVVIFFALDRVKFALGISQPEEIATGRIDMRQVEVRPYEPENASPPEDTVTPPAESSELLEEVDLLDLLPENVEIDISPSTLEPEYALKMSNPLADGELDAPDSIRSTDFEISSDLPELGRMDTELTPAAAGQLTVDPGAVKVDDGKFSNFAEDLLVKGNNGVVDNGKLDGVESLDQLLDLPPNLLLSKKTLLPSDLIFEFNSAELRESAKVGLMKLALLIDRNPTLYCWIEGHTDLIGTDEANILLSEKRAESVKSYLVESMRMDPERIITRGFGKTQPLITEGDAVKQSPNRRVEIRMRRTPPTDEPIKTTPKAQPVEEVSPETATPKAILVKPGIILPPDPSTSPPKALIVPNDSGIPRAQPVEKANPVPRAMPVEP